VQKAVATLQKETRLLESKVRSMAESNRRLRQKQDSLFLENSRLKERLRPRTEEAEVTSPFML
jgi:hypothetical protein